MMKLTMMITLFRVCFVVFCGCTSGTLMAQTLPSQYLGNAHSHNDYSRDSAFFKAYSLGFGSIEVDLYLVDGELYVAHDSADIHIDRSFDKLYLKPLLNVFHNVNDGPVYPDGGGLQLLIDPKTDGGPLLDVLSRKLAPYRHLFDIRNNPNAVKLVISGRKPDRSLWSEYDNIFYFDGDFDVDYTEEQLDRIGLFSAPLSRYSNWKGVGELHVKDKKRIAELRDSVHRLNRKIRFWAVPDMEKAWQEWIDLSIDYINTDKPELLSKFLNEKSKLPKPASVIGGS